MKTCSGHFILYADLDLIIKVFVRIIYLCVCVLRRKMLERKERIISQK